MIMFMMKENKQNFCSKMYSNLGSFLPIILVLPLFSFFFSISFLFTIPVAFIFTMFLLILRRKKAFQNESLFQDKLKEEEVKPLINVTETAENYDQQQAEAQSEYSFQSDNEIINFSVMDKTFEVNVQEFKPQADLESDSSLPSDSESSTDSIICESFEIDHQNVYSSEILAFDIVDDDDHSDVEEDEDEEDSLIEIQLPSFHFSEESKQKLESKLPDFMPEYIFKQQGLMELLEEMNDMNEDENLIEIDIAMCK